MLIIARYFYVFGVKRKHFYFCKFYTKAMRSYLDANSQGSAFGMEDKNEGYTCQIPIFFKRIGSFSTSLIFCLLLQIFCF